MSQLGFTGHMKNFQLCQIFTESFIRRYKHNLLDRIKSFPETVLIFDFLKLLSNRSVIIMRKIKIIPVFVRSPFIGGYLKRLGIQRGRPFLWSL